MTARSATVIVPTLGGKRLARMLDSLAAQTVEHETIVVDNGADGSVAETVAVHLPRARVLSPGENLGYTRAVNLGARSADGEVLVLLNDDCVCDPRFVQEITGALDPAAGVVMAAGVMRDWRHPDLIDSAGMELDRTLLVFDYLNGEPLSRLEGDVADPIGPSGAAAAFDRATFLGVGGFDEQLFAYWEDVDLVLRLRRLGLTCRLARGARGDHEHSATLGSGSARKNYLMGFGRGYVLRKWRVLTPRRALPVLVREGALCAGQAVVDRNLAGVRGRIAGYRAVRAPERYPEELGLDGAGGAVSTLRRRAARRARLARRPRVVRDRLDSLVVFHLAETTGPSRSLEAELRWLGDRGRLTAVTPGPGSVAASLNEIGDVVSLDYEALTTVPTGPLNALAQSRELARNVRSFRALIREHRPGLVLAISAMLPAVSLAARLERVPVVVYCGELFGPGHRGDALRALAGRALVRLTGRTANAIIACSHAVAHQFPGEAADVVTVYPPVDDRYAHGDGSALRAELGLPEGAPLLASVGYLTEGRGQDLLVRAMPSVLERFPDARCVIAGDPFPRPQDVAFRRRLAGLIGELDLADRVILAGHRERVADLYAAADVIVNPARASESFGRVAFEAAIAGTPAVVTRVGAVEELLRDRESAMIVPSEDPGELAHAVLELLTQPPLAERLVAGARRVAAERLRPELSLAGFRQAIELALSR